MRKAIPERRAFFGQGDMSQAKDMWKRGLEKTVDEDAKAQLKKLIEQEPSQIGPYLRPQLPAAHPEL